jgi:hypothetical protein
MNAGYWPVTYKYWPSNGWMTNYSRENPTLEGLGPEMMQSVMRRAVGPGASGTSSRGRRRR